MTREDLILSAALRVGLTFELPPTKLFKFAELITQRKPLTDEEIRDIAKQYALGLAFPYDGPTTPELFARAIERAHGIGGEA
jgi:hypothetical protein